MKISAYIVLLFLLLFTSAVAQVNSDFARTVIDSANSKFAPDKRVALVRIEAIQSGDNLVLKGQTNIGDAKKFIMDELEKNNIDFEDSIKLLPEKELGDTIYGIVNLSVANIRSKPYHPAELATQALLGTPVKVLKYDDGFYLIQTPDGYISWVDSDGIVRVTKDELDNWLAKDKVLYIKECGFSFSGADSENKRVSDLVMGDLLVKTGEEGDFTRVSYPDGREAFIENDYLMDFNLWLDTVTASEENIVETAFNFMGIPYLWGGTSSKGMDCSGFTKTVYFMNGLVLPRDASQQVHTGELVDTQNGFGNLIPGDLLFFGRKATKDKKEKVTHVAIYIGDTEYIHASGMVKVNSLDESRDNFSEYRLKSFIRAKRIINSVNKNGIYTVKDHKFYNGDF
jgi:hypothetical protein